MPDYSKAKIYKLYTDDAPDLFYYGSTIQSLAKRVWGHKAHWENGKKASSSILFNVSDNVKIVLVEYFPCNDKFELLKRERFYIENNNCVNKQIPGRTLKEYYIDNQDRIKELQQHYRNNNKDKKKQFNINNSYQIKQFDNYRHSHFGILCRNYF